VHKYFLLLSAYLVWNVVDYKLLCTTQETLPQVATTHAVHLTAQDQRLDLLDQDRLAQIPHLIDQDMEHLEVLHMVVLLGVLDPQGLIAAEASPDVAEWEHIFLVKNM